MAQAERSTRGENRNTPPRPQRAIQNPGLAAWRPGSILALLFTEFIALGLILAADLANWGVFKDIPAFIGALPLLVPWGGALGGVCAGLVRLTNNWHRYGGAQTSRYSRKWNIWYVIRFPIGAAFGTVAVLIVVFVLGAIGVDGNGDINVTEAGMATLFVIAFAVGYQQDIFAELLKRLVAVILGPGATTTDSGAFSIPEVLDFDSAPVGKRKAMDLTVGNDGQAILRIIPSTVSIDDNAFEVINYTGDIPVGGSKGLEIGFTPKEAKAYSATLTVTVGGIAETTQLSGTGI